jgi:plasmid maintenance system antidote protein VapI
MDFTDYMRATNRSNAELSRKLNVNPSYISLLIAGKRHPSIEMAQKIETVTGQTVLLEDWIIRRRQNPRPWC